MAILGYARVSTEGQSLDGQIEALKAAGADRVFQEKISGARRERDCGHCRGPKGLPIGS